MVANQVGFSTAASMIYQGSGVLGFFRGSLIELIIVNTFKIVNNSRNTNTIIIGSNKSSYFYGNINLCDEI